VEARLRLPEGEKTADSSRQVRKLRFGAGDRRKDWMTSKMATRCHRKPLDRGFAALSFERCAFAETAVRVLDEGAAVNVLRRILKGGVMSPRVTPPDSGLNVLQPLRDALIAVGGPRQMPWPDHGGVR